MQKHWIRKYINKCDGKRNYIKQKYKREIKRRKSKITVVHGIEKEAQNRYFKWGYIKKKVAQDWEKDKKLLNLKNCIIVKAFEWFYAIITTYLYLLFIYDDLYEDDDG